jgi:replicative DNA helicase
LAAERAVLGSALLWGFEAVRAALPLDPDDFSLLGHRWMWSAVLALLDSGNAIDAVTLAAQMGATRLAEAGGPGALVEVVAGTPSGLNVASYAQIVRGMALRRRALDAAHRIARLAHADDLTTRQVVEGAFAALNSLAAAPDRPALTVAAALSSVYDRWLARSRELESREISSGLAASKLPGERLPAEPFGGPFGLPTGFESLDRITGGAFDLGVLMILVALPKTGKTTLALQIALATARRDIPVVYATYEMSVERLATRLWSIAAGVPEAALRDGRKLRSAQHESLVRALDALSRLPLLFVNTPIGGLASDVLAAEQRYGRKGLLVVDNILSAGAALAAENQAAQINNAVALLDGIKLRAGWAALGLAQQRDDYDKAAGVEKLRSLLRPSMFNIFGSKAPLRLGELVLGLYRPSVIEEQIAGFEDRQAAPPGHARLSMLANRYGPSDGSCLLRFEKSVPRFEEVPPSPPAPLPSAPYRGSGEGRPAARFPLAPVRGEGVGG